MEPHVTDDLDRRLRAARPRQADSHVKAFDAELLGRLRDQPIAARRSVPRAIAVPVAIGVTVTATAVVLLGGGPSDVTGPSSAAAAITQTLHWLTPAPGTVLHARSVETMGGRTTTRELWQSADDPGSERVLTQGAHSFETTGSAIYDPATDTIYEAPENSTTGQPTPDKAKVAAVGVPVGAAGPVIGDPVVEKVRTLLQRGDMTVTGEESHDGTEAWAISLKPDAGRPVWTLWVSAADGKPLELRDPGRDASEGLQVIRWTTYEALPGASAQQDLTLTGAHPSAQVVNDPAQYADAEARLMPPTP
jgi:hypothetical protein